MNKRRRYKAKRRRLLDKKLNRLGLFFDTERLRQYYRDAYKTGKLFWDRHES